MRILTPQVMQKGASEDWPLIFSKSSMEEPTPASGLSSGLASIFTEATTGLLTTAGAAAGAAAAFGSDVSSWVYSPDSKARARSDAV